MNYLRNLFKCMLLAVLMACMPQATLAGNTDDLQEFINRQTRRTTQTHSTDDAIEIDLSKFSATERDKTLEFSNGKKFRIVNGILSRIEGINGPLVSISNGSSVEIGDGATVSGSGIPFGYPVVELEEGTLNVTQGTINGVAGGWTGDIDLSIKVPANARNCTLALSGGKVQGIMQCLANDCKTIISGGKYSTTYGPIYSDGAYCIETNSDIDLNGSVDLQGICLLGESNKIKLKSALGKKLFVTASGLAHTGAFADGRTIMEGDGYQLSNDDRQQLTSDYYNYKNDCFTLANNKITYKKDNTIKTTAELQARLSEIAQNGTSTAANPEEIRICASGISLNNYIKVPENCHAVITGGPIRFQDDYVFGGDAFYIYKSASITLNDITACNSGSWTQGTNHYLFSLYGGRLTIGENVVFKEFDSPDNTIGLARLTEGGDITYNSGAFVCANPVISGSPTNDYDGMIKISGGTIKSAQTAIDAQYDVEFKGGNIGGGTCGFRGWGTAYIYDGHIGGKAWSGYTYSNSTTYIYGGSFSEKFHNSGTTTITGGTFGDGGYGYIHNDGILNLGGSGWSGATVGNGKSGRIYILGKLEIIIHIFVTIEDITTDTPIIIGGNGYVLTEDDLEKILITLPDGYTWKYSQTLNGIIITSTTGIESATADNDGNQTQYFDINGNRLTQPQKGLSIVKSGNGKAKKLIVR